MASCVLDAVSHTLVILALVAAACRGDLSFREHAIRVNQDVDSQSIV